MSNIYFTHLTSDKTDLDMKRDAFESDQAIWYDLLASQSNQLNSTIRNGATAWNKWTFTVTFDAGSEHSTPVKNSFWKNKYQN